MKKNKMMRLASALLVAVLLTTSIISGTFAKYVTSGEAGDSARVAKFGVEIATTGTLFDTTYATDATDADGDTDGISVKSSNTENVVAPGTKNDDGLTFSFSGQPEVDVKINLTIADGYKDVYLRSGIYGDVTTQASGDYFALKDDYYPIVYTLKNGDTELVKGNLADIANYLDKYEVYVDANTDLSGEDYTYTLTWEWVFGDSENNQADTRLGDLAAGTIVGIGYNLTTDVTISATVAQVD